MKSALVTKLCVLTAALLTVGMVACSSDDDGNGGGGGDTSDDRGRPDTATGDTSPDSSPDALMDGSADGGGDVPVLDQNLNDQGGDAGTALCDQIGLGTNLGNACDPGAESPCGQGGACLSFEEGTAECFQICVPGQCESACVTPARCLLLVDQQGNPVPISEGGPNVGVCSEPQTGNQGAYDECGATAGACSAGLDCLNLIGLNSAAFCSPTCSASNPCPSRDGIAGDCALRSGDGDPPPPPTNCALLCNEDDAGTGTGCPSGMLCNGTDQGTGICLWPN
jgi:hypothetical protein